jgi:hypothetical protein
MRRASIEKDLQTGYSVAIINTCYRCMEYPTITFVLDKEYDKDSILEFLDDKDEFLDFGHERIIQFHPELERYRGKDKEIQKKAISDYVDTYYKKNTDELKLSSEKLQSFWDEIAPRYFAEIKKIFGSLDVYRERAIIASPSITNCGDIADDHTRFHIWYKWCEKPEEAKGLIAHEILHFYYYAHIREKELSNLIDQWDLAEIFNVVILGLPQFVALLGKPDFGYEQHDQYIPHYRKLWKESASLDKYLQKTNEEGLTS